MRVLDQKRDDPAVENEFRAAAVDLDIPPSRQRECEMPVSVVVVGDASGIFRRRIPAGNGRCLGDKLTVLTGLSAGKSSNVRNSL